MSTLFMLQNSHFSSFCTGHEGKAGMASLILKHNASLDLEQMYKQVVTYLPSYACPLFLRVQVSCIIALCIQNLHHLNTEMAKWITKSPFSCITRLVLDLVLFALFINGVLEKGLHKKSINLQIMFKWEKLFKWARTEIIQKDLGRLEHEHGERKRFRFKNVNNCIWKKESKIHFIQWKWERNRAKAGDSDCAQ